MPATAKPSLRFYHSKELRTRTLALLDAIDEAEDATRHREKLSDLVVALSEAGMSYFYLEPLKLAKVGFVTRQSANFGMSGALRVVSPMVRTVLGMMDDKQLRAVGKFIRGLTR